jgi:hypothetical protein
MQAILVMLLAVTLAPDATRIALDREGWTVGKDDAVHATWWWSASCAPQKLEGDQTVVCGALRNVRIHTAPHAMVTWGSAAMLRDLPDDRLPSLRANEEGVADLAVPAGEELWTRAVTENAATQWTRAAAAAREVRLSTTPALPLRIVLRGEDDQPVVRARVALLPPDCTRICPERLLAFEEKKKPGVVTAVRGAVYRVVVWSDSHAPLTRTVTATSGELALTLKPGGTLDARLVDGARKPVRGGAFEVQYRLPELSEAIHRTAAASAEGNVVLGGLPRSLVEWSAGASAFARRVDQASLTTGSVSLGEVMLHPAREVRVAVRDAAGHPVTGAKVVAQGSSFAAADGKGVALLRELPAGETALQVYADGFLAASATVAKDERELAVTLTRGATVKATLLRQSDGQAPRSARVRITNNGRQSLRTVELSEGLVLSGLRGGMARLSIQSDGAQPYDTGTLQLADGDVLDLGIVTLATGFSVHGTIVDDHGVPLLDARVRLLRTDGDSPALAHVLGNWTEVESAGDGTFQLRGLAGGSHFVVVEARGFAQRVLPNVTVSGDHASFDAGTIAMEPGHTIELVCRPEKRCGTEASILLAGTEYPCLAVRTALRQGRGSFTAVPSGTATLRLTRNQHVTHERSVTISAGREATVLEVDLPAVRVRGDVVIGSRRARAGSLLFTRAVRSTGVPIMLNGSTEYGTTIDKQWLGSFGASNACELAASGEFAVEDFEPGLYDVVFRSDGASTAAVRVEIPNVPEHHLPLRFEGAEIAGKVVDAANQPAAVRIEVMDASGASHVARSGIDGEFRLLGLSGGRAHVKATGAGRKAETEVETEDAGARNVVLRLADDPSSGLTVDVRDADGSPAAGVLVFAMANSGVIAGSTDRDGRAKLQGVAGNAPVAVHQPGGKWAFASGRSGETTRLVLPARPGAVVANSAATGDASIMAPNGFPLDRVLPMVGISSRIASGSSLRVLGLPPGAYDVSIGAFRKGVTVTPGAVAEVRFGD